MRHAWAAVGLLVAVTAGQSQITQPAASARLHHLHYRTSNVTAALAEAARVHEGSRVLLQGLGVGVKAGDHYLLFDTRSALDEDAIVPATSANQGAASGPDDRRSYRDAVRWLSRHGIIVTPPDLSATKLAAPLPEDVLDHIAFATGNLESLLQTLRAAGVTDVRRTADSAFFRANDLVIELTRDTDLPDVLWCPMHPDVRAASAGKCPICAMDLVPIPPPRIGQYRVEVTQAASSGRKGASALTLTIRDPQSGEPVSSFASLHERLLHLFIISRDLKFFAHEHPIQKGNRFELAMPLEPGAYMLLADFLPSGGSPQLVHNALVTPGFAASPFVSNDDVVEDLAEKNVDGIRVALTLDSSPGRLEAVMRFRFSDSKTGTPIRDLQPYLGVSGHLLMVSPDLTHAVHAHPEGLTSGPDINFSAEFPVPGLYKMWVQVQRKGKVSTAPFVVRVG